MYLHYPSSIYDIAKNISHVRADQFLIHSHPYYELHSEEAAPVVRDCLRQHFGKPMDSDEEILKEFAQMPLRRVLGLDWAKKTARNEMLEMNRRLNGCRR